MTDRPLIDRPSVGKSIVHRLAGYFLIWTIIYVSVMVFIANENTWLVGALLAIGSIILLFATWAKSTSPGKWLLGMRVYRTSGQRAGFLMMLLRETIGKFISGLILGLGYLWILFDRDKQGWHDKIVSTVVINERVRAEAQEASSVGT